MPLLGRLTYNVAQNIPMRTLSSMAATHLSSLDITRIPLGEQATYAESIQPFRFFKNETKMPSDKKSIRLCYRTPN